MPSGNLVAVFNNWKVWRNGNPGFSFSLGGTYTLKNCAAWGNNSSNFSLTASQSEIVLDGCSSNGDTSFATTSGLLLQGTGSRVRLYSCQFSQVAGIKTAHTNDFILSSSWGPCILFADNCKFNGVTLLNVNGVGVTAWWWEGGSSMAIPLLAIQNFNQVGTDHRQYWNMGINTLAVTRSSASITHGVDPLSQQLSPVTTSLKLISSSFYVPVDSGNTSTFSVWALKDSSYNGAAPRLILRRQDSMGVTSDTVCATLSAGVNTWQQLSYTTPTAPENGVFEFYVDCDGTAGNAYVCDAATT